MMATRFCYVHPFTCMIAGPTQSGKTEFTIALIENMGKMIEPCPTRVVWCYGEYQDRLLDLPNFVEKTDDLELLDTIDGKEASLVIIDDMMDEISRSETVSKMFTKGSHHKNMSVIVITQNLFYQSNIMRTISRNALYLVIFKNPRDRAQVIHLGRQMFPGKTAYIREAYEDATKPAHGYLLMDCTQKADDKRRLLTGILPFERYFAYVPK